MDDLELARINRNAWRREQYRLDGGKRKAENQAWKEAHREQVREASRQYQRLRYQKDKEHVRGLARESHARHREKRNAATREWAKAHPEYSNAWHAANRAKDPVLYILRNAKNRAKALGLPFNLERSDIVIPDICPVLGLPLERSNRGFDPCSPSLDRFDSSQGYVRDNVRVISWRANMLKRDGTLEEFRQIVAYMERV